jgi:hypothetical protein
MSHRDPTRRDFVTLASLCLVGTALAPLAAPIAGQNPSPRLRGLRRPDPSEADAELSVGLVRDSDTYSTFEVLPWETGLSWDDPQFGEWWPEAPQVIPASEVAIGDQGLVHTHVELLVHGLYPDTEAWWRQGIEKVELQVLYRSFDPLVEGPFPYLAWSYEGRPVPMPAQRVRFPVPIDETGSLELLLRVRRVVAGPGGDPTIDAVGVEARRHAGAFTVDWQTGRPKLQRGVYLLGLRGDTWTQPASLPEPGRRARRDLTSLVVSVEPLGEDASRRLG